MKKIIPGGHHLVEYETNTIAYELIYAKRKTLAIHVYPDRRVVVKAPKGVRLPQIHEIVLKRAGWIIRQQHKFEQYPVQQFLPRQYINGETYRYLGQQYQLQISENKIEQVNLSEDSIVVTAKDPCDKSRIARLLDQWFRSHARQVFEERLAACFPLVTFLGVQYPALAIRDMKSRWGSCSGKGKITLNLKLIYVPQELIDYVILHELCHLKELNHSRAFYALLKHVSPDWREHRERLNRIPLT